MANAKRKRRISETTREMSPKERSPSQARRDRAREDPSFTPSAKDLPTREAEGKGDRNRSLQFRKDYEEQKKGVNHRDGCCLCGDSSHMCRNFPKLGRLGAMTLPTSNRSRVAVHGPNRDEGTRSLGRKDKALGCLII
ncbi:hypothetical protein HAX54_019088 [Datura stramonium]|uniref:Uncharacterized protein n=1 Tax=Datura stramonium TaxID=4076 RepID=A0ABS8UNH8_DATST|nr:hypothetical protein [Datura stramonium]